MTLRIRWLGRVRYGDALAVQRALFRTRPGTDDWLLLLEHDHVYTMGIRARPEHVLIDPASVGAELVKADRGGDVTYHGPGQLTAYPILSVPMVLGATPAYVHGIEQLVIDTLDDLGLPGAGRIPGRPGVWVDPDGPAPRKICAVGVRLARGRSMHGFALNVAPDLSYFDHIIPCGITDRGVTSLAAEGIDVSMRQVVDAVALRAEQRWGKGASPGVPAVDRQDVAWRVRPGDLSLFSRGKGPGTTVVADDGGTAAGGSGGIPAGAGATGAVPAGAGATGAVPAGAGATGAVPAGAGATGAVPAGAGATGAVPAGAAAAPGSGALAAASGGQRVGGGSNGAQTAVAVRLLGRLAEAGVEPGSGLALNERKPAWLRVKAQMGPEFQALKRTMRSLDLVTVCEEAGCPNIFECWAEGTATFMINGDRCTRACGFCLVDTRKPEPPDPGEPARVAEAVARMGLAHAVVTAVARDDLADGGAAGFAASIVAIHRRCPSTRVEVLIPDCRGDPASLRIIFDAAPDVLNHNVETVARLQRAVRPSASYARSLAVLARAKAAGLTTKSGLILGMGENEAEVLSTLADLHAVGCDIVTIGQYLRPTSHHLPVARWWRPEEFARLKEIGEAIGIPHVESSPLTRSSYHARQAASGVIPSADLPAVAGSFP